MTSPELNGYYPNGIHVSKGFSPLWSAMAEARKRKDKEKDKDKGKKNRLFGRGGPQKNVKPTEASFSVGEGVPPTSQPQSPPSASRSLFKRSQSVGSRPSKSGKEKPSKHEGLASTPSGSRVRPTSPSGVGLNPPPSRNIPPRNSEEEVPMKALKVMIVDACKMGCR